MHAGPAGLDQCPRSCRSATRSNSPSARRAGRPRRRDPAAACGRCRPPAGAVLADDAGGRSTRRTRRRPPRRPWWAGARRVHRRTPGTAAALRPRPAPRRRRSAGCTRWPRSAPRRQEQSWFVCKARSRQPVDGVWPGAWRCGEFRAAGYAADRGRVLGHAAAQKLGIAAGHLVLLDGAPAGFTLHDLPPDARGTPARRQRPVRRDPLLLPRSRPAGARWPVAARPTTPAGALWIAWPKRTSGVADRPGRERRPRARAGQRPGGRQGLRHRRGLVGLKHVVRLADRT